MLAHRPILCLSSQLREVSRGGLTRCDVGRCEAEARAGRVDWRRWRLECSKCFEMKRIRNTGVSEYHLQLIREDKILVKHKVTTSVCSNSFSTQHAHWCLRRFVICLPAILTLALINTYRHLCRQSKRRRLSKIRTRLPFSLLSHWVRRANPRPASLTAQARRQPTRARL